jgi:hypothetical protein
MLPNHTLLSLKSLAPQPYQRAFIQALEILSMPENERPSTDFSFSILKPVVAEIPKQLKSSRPSVKGGCVI